MKKVLIGFILLGLFACEEYTSRDVSLSWDTSKGQVLINGVEVTGGRYEKSFSLDTEAIIIDFIGDESDGWFTNSCFVSGGWFSYVDEYEQFPATIKLNDGPNEISFEHKRAYITGLKVSDREIYGILNYPYLTKKDKEYYSYNKATSVYTQISESAYSAAHDSLEPIPNKGELSYRVDNTTVIAINGASEKVLAEDFNDPHFEVCSFNEDESTALYVIREGLLKFRVFVWDLRLNAIDEIAVDFYSRPGYEYHQTFETAIIRNNQIFINYDNLERYEGVEPVDWHNRYSVFAKINLDTLIQEDIYRAETYSSGLGNNIKFDFFNNHYYGLSYDNELKVYDYNEKLLYSDSGSNYLDGYDEKMNAVFYTNSTEAYYKIQGQPRTYIFEYKKLK